MKQFPLNGRWVIWTTDEIAAWDAMTGSPAEKTGWEWSRLDSMQRNLHYGDTLFEIGAEHGALTTVIAREFVGPENMVLFEPSPEMWINLRKHWIYNGFDEPRGFWPGFVGDKSDISPGNAPFRSWPGWASPDEPEVGAMPYRYLNGDNSRHPIDTITVDDFIATTGITPTALNIDVEGAEMLVLRGANEWMEDAAGTQWHIWVSIHLDLMEGFGHGVADFLEFRNIWRGHWDWENLGTDHETHWHGWSQ